MTFWHGRLIDQEKKKFDFQFGRNAWLDSSCQFWSPVFGASLRKCRSTFKQRATKPLKSGGTMTLLCGLIYMFLFA